MIKDTSILFSRIMKHITRSPDTIITTAIMPIAMMLLFVYVFGGALNESISETSYINYLLPGILLITIVSGVSYVGFRVYEDKQKGMFARIKSMPIVASSFLWAHVLSTMIANYISLLVVFLVAFLMGFRSNASILDWIAIVAILSLLALSLTWLMIIPGMAAKTATGAYVWSYPLMFLPFLSSAFVPTDTMPGPLRWFAEHQPVTSITDAVRGLLSNHSVSDQMGSAILWLLVLLFASILLAKSVYRKTI